MKARGRYHALIGWVFTFALAVLAAGCGGSNSTSSENGPPDGAAAASVTVRAETGNIVAVRVNETATLDGSASSTTSTDPLTYAWSFTSKPDGSSAVLQNATSVSPSFSADVAGTYMVQLLVTSGAVTSQRAVALVEVTTDGYLTGKRVHTSYTAQCADCHDGRYVAGDGPIDPVMAKSGDHLATSNLCQACHTTFGFDLIRFVDHQEVFGNCSTCHNGVSAIGKSEFHVATSAECGECHTTTSFLELGPDGTFDHAGITRACATCHNGTTAIGKYEGHFATDSDCSACHSTDSFKNAFVDHSDITDNCASCHNGSDAKGQTAGHPDMAVDCGVCHSTSSFSMGGVYNHRLVDSSVQPCATCHNDDNSINARGKASKVNHVPTTEDCGVCHGVGGGNFADGIFEHSSNQSEFDENNCAKCHGASGNGSGLGMSDNHMPTSEDCHVCHTPGTFTTGFYDHDGVVSGCTTCHNHVISAGKPENHIPTTPDDQDCAACHVIKFDDFSGAVFNHAGITSNCASCHNGEIGTGKSTHHMPTTRDCSDCHLLKFDDFTGGSFDHMGVNNDCATCHDGVIAKGKKVNHIPALNECSQCHRDTTANGFASTIFLSDVHPDLTTGCEGCHKAQFFPDTPSVVKAADHLPTSQDCRFCHTNVAFSPSIFDHTGISDNCASCHDGSASNVALGALGKTSVASGHPDTTDDCGVCHGLAGGSFADASFDHTGRVDNCAECHGDTGTATKKNAGHVPTTQDCSVCHVPGSFATAVFSHEGIVDNCSQCHDGSVATATVKSTNHLPTSKDCSECHNTTAFAGAKFDHQGIVDNCATCHDGVIAMGKISNHVPTNDDCSVCHQTTGFKPATFDHAGIVDNCQSCHDGVFAQGKKDGHVQTTEDCGVCHSVPSNGSGFVPATFDHSTVAATTRCDSCHVEGSATIVGKDDKVSPPHLVTTLDCRDCHTTATFVGGKWVHDAGTAGVCKTCHSTSGGATPQPSTGHFDTTVECDSCHTTDGWAPASTFDHCAGKTKSKTGTCTGSDYPGDHKKALACTDCHVDNSQVPTYSTPFDTASPPNDLTPYCAGCHRKNFKQKGDHNGGKSGTVLQNKDCSGGGSGCHKVTSKEFG